MQPHGFIIGPAGQLPAHNCTGRVHLSSTIWPFFVGVTVYKFSDATFITICYMEIYDGDNGLDWNAKLKFAAAATEKRVLLLGIQHVVRREKSTALGL